MDVKPEPGCKPEPKKRTSVMARVLGFFGIEVST
jgi:hypothetical protein